MSASSWVMAGSYMLGTAFFAAWDGPRNAEALLFVAIFAYLWSRRRATKEGRGT